MPESDNFKIKTWRRARDGPHDRAKWLKEARVDNGPWRYLLGAQKIVGSAEWIVRAQDTDTGEVLARRSPGLHHHLAVQKELVRRLHEKAGRHDRAR